MDGLSVLPLLQSVDQLTPVATRINRPAKCGVLITVPKKNCFCWTEARIRPEESKYGQAVQSLNRVKFSRVFEILFQQFSSRTSCSRSEAEKKIAETKVPYSRCSGTLRLQSSHCDAGNKSCKQLSMPLQWRDTADDELVEVCLPGTA